MKEKMDKITKVLVNVATIILLIVIAIMVINAIGRRGFNHPVFGTMDIVQYGTLLIITLAMGRTGFEDRHLSIRMVSEYFPKRLSSVITSVCYAISGILYLALMVNYITMLPKLAQTHRTTDLIKLPFTVVYVILAFCMLIIGITFVYQSVQYIKNGFSKEKDEIPSSEESAEER